MTDVPFYTKILNSVDMVCCMNKYSVSIIMKNRKQYLKKIYSHLDHSDVIDVSEAETDQGDVNEEMNLNDSVS